MKTDADNEKDIMSGEFLEFKDEVYEAIFGNSERISGRFYFKMVDGVPKYGRYIGENRMDVYSNSEVLFGSHTIIDWKVFWQSIGKAIFENLPVVSHIILGVEMYQALFFSGSIVGATNGIASEFLDKYAKETNNTVLNDLIVWPNKVFGYFSALLNALDASLKLNNLNDIKIYSKIQEQNYRTVFENCYAELSIEEIIRKYSNN